MELADIHKTAVATLFRRCEFLKMLFGLHNAAQKFQHFIDQVPHGLPFTYAYIEDLIASSSADDRKHHLRAVFQCLDRYGIVINPLKSVLGVKELQTLLGHHVSNSGFGHSRTKYKRCEISLNLIHNVSYENFWASSTSTTYSLTMEQPH